MRALVAPLLGLALAGVAACGADDDGRPGPTDGGAALDGPPPPPPPAPPPPPGDAGPGAAVRLVAPEPGDLYHAVYPAGPSGEEDDLTPATLDAYTAAAGRPVAWVYFSDNWYRDRLFPAETASWVRDAGAVPFVRLMLRSSPEQDIAEPVFTVEAIARGDMDEDLAAWGRDARDFATPLLVEWGTEMNGRWFPWNGVWNGGAGVGPERFVQAFRRIVETVRGAGAHNVAFVFHVNADDDPPEAWNAFERYWPGDDVVDWVGFSAYGAQTPLDEEWPVFRDAVDSVVPRLAALAPGIPILALELGVTAGNPLGDPVAWADEALGDLLAPRWPEVRGFSWWNEHWQNDDDPSHDTEMRIQRIDGMPEVFRAHLESARVVDRPILR